MAGLAAGVRAGGGERPSADNPDLTVACATSSLKCERGIVRCPAGVGFGVTIDPAFVTAAKPVETNVGAAE